MIFGKDPMYLMMLIPLFIASITLHEWGHAFAADRLGDRTPRDAGRLTLNPIAHLDLVGSLMLLFAGFGWAKPVPVSLHHMKNPRLGNFLVSIAGPAMNFVLAVLALVALKYAPGVNAGASLWLQTAFGLNLILMIFNMLPIPPLDGGHILESILPRRFLPTYRHLMPYGVAVLLVMVFFPGANAPLRWLYGSVQGIMYSLI